MEGVSSALATNLVIIVVPDPKHWCLLSMHDCVRKLMKGMISVQKYLIVWLCISEIPSRFFCKCAYLIHFHEPEVGQIEHTVTVKSKIKCVQLGTNSLLTNLSAYINTHMD